MHLRYHEILPKKLKKYISCRRRYRKFIYTKIWKKYLNFFLTKSRQVKFRDFFSYFMAYSEYINFKIRNAASETMSPQYVVNNFENHNKARMARAGTELKEKSTISK